MTKFFFGNWVTRCYLFAVGVSAAVLIGAQLATGDHGPSFAGIYLIGLTAPVSVIFAPIALLGDGWLAIAILWLSVVTGMLLNTLLINTIVGEAGRFRSRRA
ncbi:SCO4225 family membrane protein [Actinoplanes sp. NPDC049681]|uniref:SCO4225 family membrane protein n=1 Tax=Actinoplanes sp. NPDC049681 TaxID=3363905 RepID=UPI00379162EC